MKEAQIIYHYAVRDSIWCPYQCKIESSQQTIEVPTWLKKYAQKNMYRLMFFIIKLVKVVMKYGKHFY